MANRYLELQALLVDLEQLSAGLEKLRDDPELGAGSAGFVGQAKGILISLQTRLPRVRDALDREKIIFDQES